MIEGQHLAGNGSPKRRRMDSYSSMDSNNFNNPNPTSINTNLQHFAFTHPINEDFDFDAQSSNSTTHAQTQNTKTNGTSNSVNSASNSNAQQQQQQPRKRINRACEPCRRKRSKCSGDLPCSLCASKPHLCVYAPERKTKREDLFGDDPVGNAGISGGGASKVDMIEGRLAAIEQMLSRMIPLLEQATGVTKNQPNMHNMQSSSNSSPVVSTFPSLQHLSSTASTSSFAFSPSSISLSPISAPTAPNHTSRLSSALQQQQQQQQQQQPFIDGNNSSIYKTGGFLINTEETALTFWGSTSALGGTTNNAHLYKAIPRFINGILMVHIPARTYQEEQRESAKNTPSGSLSASGSGSASGGSLGSHVIDDG
ncbi:hypothetical protein BDR26DRAFT_939754 [Obelidium mucronatum]|nr:hypothetical protein BDR26DRAFT_939754 [Obelidium mucronatum]